MNGEPCTIGDVARGSAWDRMRSSREREKKLQLRGRGKQGAFAGRMPPPGKVEVARPAGGTLTDQAIKAADREDAPQS